MVEKDKRLHVRVTETELEMLDALAMMEERSVADVVRRLIRQAHAIAFGNPKTAAEAVALRNAREGAATAATIADGMAKRAKKKTKKK